MNDGQELWLFMSANKCEVDVWDVDAKKLVRTIKPADAPAGQSGQSAGVAPDGSVFTVRLQNQSVYDGVTGEVMGGLPTAKASRHRRPDGWRDAAVRQPLYEVPTGTRRPARAGGLRLESSPDACDVRRFCR